MISVWCMMLTVKKCRVKSFCLRSLSRIHCLLVFFLFLTEEMDTDGAAIQELIQSLDAQKDEAILRTFRGVSTHFAEVFSELVPGGAGQLIMRTSLDAASKQKKPSSSKSTTSDPDNEEEEELQDHNLDEDGPGDAQALAISTFQGVQVRVSFSGAGQQYQMNQLSGGQKALVALALIFAIQRCDPAPFYLFDEIDQALDANYRAGVARLIQKQVNSETAPAQFITTTFRPELVAVADRCYGIALQDRVSEIRSLEKVRCLQDVCRVFVCEGPQQFAVFGSFQRISQFDLPFVFIPFSASHSLRPRSL